MKAYIGPHRNWIGPYQIAEALCWWARPVKDEIGIERKPEWVHKFGTWLAEDKNGNDTWLSKACTWVHSKKKRKIKVRIDKYDTWNMDHTLAPIILPMLKQLKATKHGAQIVDIKDVPWELQMTGPSDEYSQLNIEFETDEQDRSAVWDLTQRRWDWVLDEMIHAFESILDDSWEDKYRSGEIDLVWLPVDVKGNPVPEDEAKLFQMERGPKDTYQCDYEGLQREWARIDNGFRLFGKYYRGLWD